ncbi:MAG TPA: hypothetical protein VNM22_08320 [Candidatus Limnocylindrales bacterium]|nr:hypothetical protein [Candidatus Limnocylindrales bacterium]
MKKEEANLLGFEGEEKPTKKPYHAPQLTVYGTVEQITRYLEGPPVDLTLGYLL